LKSTKFITTADDRIVFEELYPDHQQLYLYESFEALSNEVVRTLASRRGIGFFGLLHCRCKGHFCEAENNVCPLVRDNYNVRQLQGKTITR